MKQCNECLILSACNSSFWLTDFQKKPGQSPLSETNAILRFIYWMNFASNKHNKCLRKKIRAVDVFAHWNNNSFDLRRFSTSVESWWINYLSLFLFLHVIDDWKPIHWTDSTEILFLPPFNLVPRQCHWPVRFSYRKPSHIRQTSIFATISIFKSKRGRKSKRPCDILVWDESYVSEVSACRR